MQRHNAPHKRIFSGALQPAQSSLRLPTQARFNGRFKSKFCGLSFNLPSASIAMAKYTGLPAMLARMSAGFLKRNSYVYLSRNRGRKSIRLKLSY